jgi:Fic family protein
MFAVSAKGDWTGWLKFFLHVCADTCHTSIRVIDRLLALQAAYREKAMASFRSTNVIILIDHLFETPMVSTPAVKSLLGVTHRAARMTIANLEEIGVLRKVEGPTMPEFFAAREILRAGE